MKIGIIDADLIGRKKHRFPNLASMKISGYHKQKGHNVSLLLSYDNLELYDKVYVSKVFTDTKVDERIFKLSNVEYGGTGFFYDKSPNLPYEIEHHMPDYSLYDEFIQGEINRGINKKEFDYYCNYSIGYTTRGCFRKCAFCVNKNSNSVKIHSPVSEFLDTNRKYICLLDDNVLGSPKWEEIFNDLSATNKKFQFKQGMDERILTDKKCEVLSKSKYKGDLIFAFDNIEDSKIIEEKLKLLKQYTNKQCMFYVFCGFDRDDKYDEEFWLQDIINVFERVKILMKYGCIPYIMRYAKYNSSPYRGIYITLARWCNQPNFYKKKSFREFCGMKGNEGAATRYLNEFTINHPEISEKYFDMKFEDIRKK